MQLRTGDTHLDTHAARTLHAAADDLRSRVHLAVYDDAGQRTADGILRAADTLAALADTLTEEPTS